MMYGAQANEFTHKKRWSQLSLAGLDRRHSSNHRRGTSKRRHNRQRGLTLLYWRIGKRIVDEVLGKERAAYGQQIVVSVSRQLVQEYGPSFGEKNLRRMMQFA